MSTSQGQIQQGVSLFAVSALATYCLAKAQTKRHEKAALYDFILQNSHETVTISCPGKVLIAGGYLVLERPNVGVTIAGTSRFFTTIHFFEQPVVTGDDKSFSIHVSSPQFYEEYKYKYDIENNSLLAFPGSPGNTFVEKCLYMTLAFIKHFIGIEQYEASLKILAKRGHLGIKLRADNDFYSQTDQVSCIVSPLLIIYLWYRFS